jgi:DNA-binding NarL/FixJ family response regulator
MEQVIGVAVVDDHPIVLRGLVGLLQEQSGFSVRAAEGSIDALLAGPGKNAEVVLLDLDLGDNSPPGDNIRALLECGAAVVVFSATAAPATVRAAMRAGAAGYVPKTDRVDDLLTAVRAAATGGGWVSPSLAFVLLTDDAPDRPGLSPQESTALQLYAAGLPLKSVARRMEVSQETAKQYIDRVRLKYRKVGRDAPTKIDLYRRAIEDGHLPDKPPPG